MSFKEVMKELRRRDIELYKEGERVRFRAPHGAMDADLRAALDAYRDELIEFMSSPEKCSPTIEAVPRDDVLPLSFGQERLWFLDRLDPGDIAYNVPIAVEIEGTLNVPILEKSLNRLIEHHEILRTTYELHGDGRPVQRICESKPISIDVRDLRDRNASTLQQHAAELARNEARKPFDLVNGPLMRAQLYLMRSVASRHTSVFVLVFHHIVTDDWSSIIFFKELASIYRSLLSGSEIRHSSPIIQYADFAVAQRNWLRGPALDRLLSYWKSKLNRASWTVALPTPSAPRSTDPTADEDRADFEQSREICAALQAMGRDAGATQFMIFLAAFKVLLHRYTGQRDICVGTVIANRHWLDTEALIGFFTNTLVLRVDLSGNPSFVELLGRVKTVTLDAQAHQDLPFEMLVHALRSSGEGASQPNALQVAVVFHKTGFGQVEFPGVEVRPLDWFKKRPPFELVLHLTEQDGRMLGRFEFDSRIFDRDLVEGMARHYCTLIESVAADPTRRIGSLPMLSVADRKLLLTDWNDTSRDDSNDLCIHELFERRAESRPDAPAVTFGEITVTYRALNAMANRLARRLVEHGVGPETLVGICVERSLDMIVGLLGVLKAGGAYLPLDPINPNERLAFMIEDAGPSLILTQGELSERLPTNVPSWRLDAIQRDTDPCDDRNLEARACRQNLAYVIYTSGSTGRPKGVMVAHAGLANYTHEVLARLPKSPAGLNFALVSTFGADLGNTVLFASLAASGCLHLPTRETVADPALIKSYIEEHRIDVLKITPSHLSAISGTDETYEFCPREALFLGGEALSSEIVRNAATRAPLCRQFNHYGPTECTVGVLMHQIDDPGSQVGHIPLGRPIANTRLFIVGAEFELVPMGAAGELLIEGIGLARGYLGRPDLTAERFVPDPFGGEGTRLYRTGDLVRYRRDGVIEFLGRIDDQIKIRGYRVETGEIEAALSQIDGVRACAVVFQNKPGRTQLVAHIVPKSGREFQQESLRRTLSRALPDHMIPSAFALVDSLPLTPNGKVDRKALIAIDWAAPPAPGYEAPRTFTEGALCRIWADLLGLERVGAEDNFFALGGHSLLAAQATARISRELMVTLPLRVLYEARTLSEVAASVDILIELARSSIAIDVEPTIAVEEIEL